MRNIKNWLIVLLITAVSLTSSLLSGALNWINQFIICGVSYFLVGLIYQKNFRVSRLIYGSIAIVPFLSIYTMHVLLHNLLHIYPIAFLPLIAVFSGLIINRLFTNGMPKSGIIARVSAGIAIIVILGYFGMPNWLAYTLSEKSPDKFPAPSILLTNINGDSFNLSNQSGKILVLDFWSSGCGICFKKFPDFDKLKQKYEDETDIVFYGVNLIHPREELSSVKKTVHLLPYSFTTLYTDHNSARQIRELLKIDAVPKIVIINKKGEVIFTGDLNTEKYVFIDNIYDVIESALEH